MARYRDSVCRLCRREAQKLFLKGDRCYSEKCAVEKRNYPPDRVARAIIKAIRRNRAMVPVTPEAWLVYYLKRWMPWLVGRIARRDFV